MNSHPVTAVDRHFYDPENLAMYLYQCHMENQPAMIDLLVEAHCCETIGLYRLLDNFCSRTGYDPKQITIRTNNPFEKHDRYQIELVTSGWYTLTKVQEWMQTNTVPWSSTPKYHFGNFVGRSNWARLWIGSTLYRYHRERTLQTFHSGPNYNYCIPSADGIPDCLNLDDLNFYNCDDWPAVAEFLDACPIIIKVEDIERIQNTEQFISAVNNNCYPIQHPANLAILPYYQDIFVDVICESRTVGNTFLLNEKTWRAILAKRPFILMGTRESVKNLHRLGFRTFNYWWSEEYDFYGEQNRVKIIRNLLDDIAKFSVEEMHEMLEEMKIILDNNYERLRTITIKEIKQILTT